MQMHTPDREDAMFEVAFSETGRTVGSHTQAALRLLYQLKGHSPGYCREHAGDRMILVGMHLAYAKLLLATTTSDLFKWAFDELIDELVEFRNALLSNDARPVPVGPHMAIEFHGMDEARAAECWREEPVVYLTPADVQAMRRSEEYWARKEAHAKREHKKRKQWYKDAP